jgi:hypothetical protein
VYFRFVIGKKDETSHQAQGLFTAAHDLLDDGDLTSEERAAIMEVLIWFNKNLRSLRWMTASRAIFWYKDSATECLSKMWDLKALLEFHGYFVEVVRCRALGHIVYEDANQVIAYPSPHDVRG